MPASAVKSRLGRMRLVCGEYRQGLFDLGVPKDLQNREQLGELLLRHSIQLYAGPASRHLLLLLLLLLRRHRRVPIFALCQDHFGPILRSHLGFRGRRLV
jgi:hypothetical protein